MILNDIKNEDSLNFLYDIEDGKIPVWLYNVIMKTGHQMLKFHILKQQEQLSSDYEENVLFDGEVTKKRRKRNLNFNDSLYLLPSSRKQAIRPHNYKQMRYPKLNSFEIRFRKMNDRLQPAVISNNPAKKIFNENKVHIDLRKDNENNDTLYMCFSDKLSGTSAPKNNPFISRLRAFGKNKSTGEITTYSVSSVEFQKTILSYAGIDIDKLKNNDVITLRFVERKSLEPDKYVFEILRN